MKRSIICLLLVCILLFTAACSATQPSDAPPAEADPSTNPEAEAPSASEEEAEEGEQEEIDYNATMEIRFVGHFYDDARKQIFEDVAGMLKEKWPNVTLINDSSPDHGTKLVLEMPTGDGPEIVAVDDLYQQQLLPYLYDLTDIVEEHNFVERSLEGALDYNNQRTPGHYYSIPTTMSPCAVFYNKDIFEELDLEIPTTIEEFEAVCDKILAESDYIPLCDAGMSNRHVLWMLYNDVTNEADMDLVRAWYYQEETDPAVADAFIAAYEKLQSWCEKGYFGDIETVLGVDHLVYISNLYANGNYAMSYDGDWRIADFEATDVPTGVFAYPSEYNTNSVDFSFALSKEAGEDPTIRAFFEDFVEAYFSQEIVAKFYEAGYSPSILFDATGLEVTPLRAEFMAAIENQGVGYYLDNAASGMFEALTKITQMVMLGEMTPEDAWAETEAAYIQGMASTD